MSFRARLTRFFVLIVVIPMIAVGFLVFRLISESQQSKTDARANGVLSTADSVYRRSSSAASLDASSIARLLSSQTGRRTPSAAALRGTLLALANQSGLARITVAFGPHTAAAVGSPNAVAPGSASVTGRRITVVTSELTASQYVDELASPGVDLLVREGGRVLGASTPTIARPSLPTQGSVTVKGVSYRAATLTQLGFSGSPVEITVLASVSSGSGGSAAGSRMLALAFFVGFLLLALSFSIWASRGLQGQVSRFLHAARRVAGGDFSSPIRVEGHDEFAALGAEFNNMSDQLAQRLDELSQERARLREAIRRIGQTFASNLDRPALLELALKTAVDAVSATGGRVTARPTLDQPLEEAIREGSLDQAQDAITIAERVALETADAGEGTDHGWNALSVPMGSQTAGRIHGVITVAREGEAFSVPDRELLRSLASQATLALENVDLHLQVSRQAVTDELTGLANHGRFQELLGAEVEQVRRYHHPIGLIMVDIDNFKTFNDTYGHQQGDVVLRAVARVLADSSREVDYPARYGGEELAVILPHTDLDGAYAIAERIRTAIESVRVPRIDQNGMLTITASLGVAASSDGDKDALIAEADAALYQAKRQGKNRTVCAPGEAANVVSAE